MSDFAPKKRAPGPTPEAVRKAAENSEFKSREPERGPESSPAQRTERRIYRTGRNAQFSCKADPLVVDQFYAICNRQDWVMGETLRRTVEALERELGDQG